MKSFSSQVKDEVLASVPSSQCCRRALLFGLMINAECGVGDAIYFRITGGEIAPLIKKLLFEQFFIYHIINILQELNDNLDDDLGMNIKCNNF